MTEQKRALMIRTINSLCPSMPTIAGQILVTFNAITGDYPTLSTPATLTSYIRGVVDTLYELGYEMDAKAMHDFLMLVRREVI